MSNYTTQIRFICESKSGLTESVGFSGIMNAINESVDEIFNFDWPIFNEAYRLPLEVKILRHFYTREISEETFGLWQLRLWDRLNVIMPYYNQLYQSELIKFNPLYDIDLYTEHNRANDGQVDKSENGVFNRTDSRNRTTDRNVIEDGTNETDFNAERKGNNSTNLNEGSSLNSKNSDTENTNANTKNWDSNITSNNREGTGTRSDKNVNRYSDTPQGNVNIGGGPNDGNAGAESVFGNGYLTNVTIVDAESKTNDVDKSESLTDGTSEGVSNQVSSRNGSTETNSDRVLSGIDEREDIERNNTKNYNSKITEGNEKEGISGVENHTNTVTGKIKNFSTEDFIQRVCGKRNGLTYSKMLDEFRKTFLNIDRMILNDLEPLFIGLWE